ncbi:MAG: bifunctional (p)ppGpp synthetase/guanosine-3',5'-bis(diphosphate) 3'-pyrophosphohydrolase [Deltaproteobacteria bacterium]|nr:bifunctional (p)ppGpp synthetase/guanosine-3',5'-bis(diphosphate) 3'-pyrophosphohydrolase [Deltaproteobacteria bacterium]
MVRLDDILDKVSAYNPGADLDIIRKAYVFSAKVHEGQLRASGEPYLSHPLEVANILTEFKMDAPVVATGLLHDTVEDTHTSIEKIEELFGAEVAVLVDGLTKISKLSFDKREDREAENFRKMILAMARDMRVVLIKLADRLHNMRTLSVFAPEKRMKIARETIDIYAPLANRLGIGWVKNELEDLAFKYLEPDEYERLEGLLNAEKEKREANISGIAASIEAKLAENGITAKVSGRVKSIYGVHQKMTERGVDFEDIGDLTAFRILVDDMKACYSTLGVVHALWRPVPGRFKDYIALPKPNFYQSLHTTVIGPLGERMEVQIRTEEMHRSAEYGIAAHWKYKEGKAVLLDRHDETYAWLRQLLEWQRDLKDSSEFLDTLKLDFFSEDVFVFTPQGEIKAFPAGSTAVDFAYAVHTDVGHRCLGARVNGKGVPLKYQLKNGDVVEIVTAEGHVAKHDWLRFVVTSRAKAKIRQWLKAEERRRGVELGKEILSAGLGSIEIDMAKAEESGEIKHAVKELGLQSVDHLFMNVGYGKLDVKDVIAKFSPAAAVKPKPQAEQGWGFMNVFDRFKPQKKKPVSGGVVVKGVEDAMVKFASCCNPLPGDQIVGFITHGHGITVHTRVCQSLHDVDRERVIDAEWEKQVSGVRQVRLDVMCKNEKGILADMCAAVKEADANIAGLDIETSSDNRAVCTFIVEVKDVKHLKTIMRSLQRVKRVINVTRVIEKPEAADNHGKGQVKS